MELVVVDAAGDTGRVVADLVAERQPDTLGASTGSSPIPAYRQIVERKALPRSTTLYLLDEYVGLPAGSDQRYRAHVTHQLADPLGGLPIEGPDVDAVDLDRAAASYEARLRDLGGVDMQVLGIGRNGHIGFNEPGTPFDSVTRVATLAAQTRLDNARFFGSIEAVPARSITQGLATIASARQVILIATGGAKATAVAALCTQPPSPRCPASVLAGHPDFTIVADRAACGALPDAASPSFRSEHP